MTYPKVDFLPADEQHGTTGGVAASPRFPEIEERILRYWKEDGTFPASVEAPRGRRRTGPTSSSSTTGRPSPTACRTTATCSPATSRTSCRATRPCAGAGSSAGSAGTPTACRPSWRRSGPRAADQGRHPRAGHREVQRRLPGVGAEVHRRVAGLRHPPGALGRLRARLQDAQPDYMESVIWAFKTLYDKGLIYEGLRVLPYCWNDETPLSNHELRMDDEVYQQRQDPVGHRLGASWRPASGLMAWTTTPWTLPSNLALAVGPDIDYVVGRARRASATSWPRPALGAYARELGEDAADRVVARLKGAELVGRRYTPLFDFFADTEKWGTEQAYQVIPATMSPPTTAPASCTWRRRTARTTSWSVRRRASRRCSPSTTVRSSPPPSRRTRGCRCSRPTSRSSTTSRPPASLVARGATTTPTRTAGAAGTR